MIPGWLAVTAEHDVSVGLSREDVLRRASLLRELLQGREVDPARVALDDDLKAVFHGLVALVTDIDPKVGRHLAREANAVYHFIRAVEWDSDVLGERDTLLRSCAEAGWRALGIDLQDVCAVRSRLEDGIPLTSEGEEVSRGYRRSILRTLATLRPERNRLPAAAAQNALVVYERTRGDSGSLGFLDERAYVQGSAALSVAVPLRLLGRFDDATVWLDCAEQSFRACVNPAPLLSVIQYARLCLLFDREDFDRMLELLPAVRKGLHETGMRRYSLKCDLAWSICLNNLGRQGEAKAILEQLRHDEQVAREEGLYAMVLTRLADHLQSEGRFAEASALLTTAAGFLESPTCPGAKGDLYIVLGDLLRRQGRYEEAMSAFVEGIRNYDALGLIKWVAFGRLLKAEMYLALSRPREAEQEILLALPVIEKLRLVPDGFAAIALLSESLKRQKTSPEDLQQLRAYLQRKP